MFLTTLQCCAQGSLEPYPSCLIFLHIYFYIRGSDGSIELTAFDEDQKLKKLRDMEELERVSPVSRVLIEGSTQKT